MNELQDSKIGNGARATLGAESRAPSEHAVGPVPTAVRPTKEDARVHTPSYVYKDPLSEKSGRTELGKDLHAHIAEHRRTLAWTAKHLELYEGMDLIDGDINRDLYNLRGSLLNAIAQTIDAEGGAFKLHITDDFDRRRLNENDDDDDAGTGG